MTNPHSKRAFDLFDEVPESILGIIEEFAERLGIRLSGDEEKPEPTPEKTPPLTTEEVNDLKLLKHYAEGALVILEKFNDKPTSLEGALELDYMFECAESLRDYADTALSEDAS
jgi:hypothetical protein